MIEKIIRDYSCPTCKELYVNMQNVLCGSPNNGIEPSEEIDYGTF